MVPVVLLAFLCSTAHSRHDAIRVENYCMSGKKYAWAGYRLYGIEDAMKEDLLKFYEPWLIYGQGQGAVSSGSAAVE